MWLDITMHQPACMRMSKCFCDITCDGERIARKQVPLVFDKLFERFAGYVFHDDVVLALRNANIVDIHDIRMREAGGRLRFLMKFFNEFFIALELLVKDFHGHEAIQQAVFRLVDIGHPAAANKLEELIALIQDTIHRWFPPFVSMCCLYR